MRKSASLDAYVIAKRIEKTLNLESPRP